MKYPKQSLTLHLYRYEEVLSSVRWSLIKQNHTEAIFWGLELYDSDMMEDLGDLLISTWVQWIGFGKSSFPVLAELQKVSEMDRDEFIQNMYSWCRVPRDSTGFSLLLKGVIAQTTWQPRFAHASQYDTIEQATEDCLRRGKLTEAWLLARALDSDIQWTVLNKVAKLKGRTEQLDVIRLLEFHCLSTVAAFILVSITDEAFRESIIPLVKPPVVSELINAIGYWDSQESIRKRRVYKVKPEAISFWCSRTSIPVSESSLNDIECDLEKNLKGSHCWQTILDDYEENGSWKSDQFKEMFYNTYFPWLKDDIPDEWSLKDKEQSHGRGLGKTPEIGMRHFINGTLGQKNSIGFYTQIRRVTEKDVLPNIIDWDIVYDAMRVKCSDALNLTLPFRPVKKQFDLP
jgi:hypothetical protein